jgi:hypothetical protein
MNSNKVADAVGGVPVDIMKCHTCVNLGVEGCPMGDFLWQKRVTGENPTPFKPCTAYKNGEDQTF